MILKKIVQEGRGKYFFGFMLSIVMLSYATILKGEANSGKYTAPKVKKIIGLYEKVAVLPRDLVYTAKIDTGATNSSMHAVDIERYSLGEQEFVRFLTVDSNEKVALLELPVVRNVRIKQHATKKSQRRPIVELGICLGSVYKTVPVTLTDRSRFKYPFLIGASYLKGSFVVDVSKENTSTANCDLVGGR